MKKKAEKKTQADELRAQLGTVSTVILSTFQGITVEQDTKLRRSVEAAGGHYEVVKNTIAERAAEGTPTEGLLKNLKGTNSIAYTKTDPVALAKILTKVAKDVPAFQFRAGWVEGRVVSIQEINQLAQLPSKEELLSKVMFMLNAPAQRIASALAALPRNIAVVTSEAAKANKFGGGSAGEAAPAASPAPEAAQ
jgi:large subunit ribosomal protein L10